MKHVPLSRSKHLLPFSALLNANGVNVSRLLKKARLSSACLEGPDTLIPGPWGAFFRELAAQKTGYYNISLEATRHLELEDLGDFGKAILMEPTLRGSIGRFQELAATESSNVTFDLCPQSDGDLWFGLRFPSSVETGEWHDYLYVVCWMLKVAQLADPIWSPAEILLGLKATPERIAAIEMLGSTARFQQNGTGFLVPASLLALPVTKLLAPEALTETGLWSGAPAQTFAGSLRQVIRSHANDCWLSVEDAGEVINQSVRTLQRRLSTEQQTYSGLIQQCRAELADNLLENSEATIAEIANQLGYRNQSHFTRAFYRWAKVSPSEFRQHRR